MLGRTPPAVNRAHWIRFIRIVNRSPCERFLLFIRPRTPDHDTGLMSEKLNVFVLERSDPSQNVSLFGDPTLVRERGRIGQRSRQRVEFHQTEDRAAEALESGLRRKQLRGYQIRGL